MPDFTQKTQDHIVIVDAGSGVLIRPSSGIGTYILTAKHVIETAPNSGVYRAAEDIAVTTYTGNIVPVQQVRISPRADLAILISEQEINAYLTPAISKLERSNKTLYYGYPSQRRGGNEDDRLREYEGEVTASTSETFTLRLEGEPEHGEIVGSSGGGVFVIIGDDLFLCGIESRVEGRVDREFHGKVVCIPMSVVDELIDAEGLDRIFPVEMKSFLALSERVFNCYDQAELPANLIFLKAQFRQLTKKLGSNEEVSPIDLYKKFQSALLICNSPVQDLYSVDLWIAYLEFLVISCLIDEAELITIEYIEANSANRRFLFSADNKKWAWRLLDIFRSDFRGLKRKGKIIISTGELNASMQPMKPSLDRIVPDIGRSATGELRVDAGILNPVDEFDIYHLTGLHKECVLAREYELAEYYAGKEGAGPEELMALVRRLYSAHI